MGCPATRRRGSPPARGDERVAWEWRNTVVSCSRGEGGSGGDQRLQQRDKSAPYIIVSVADPAVLDLSRQTRVMMRSALEEVDRRTPKEKKGVGCSKINKLTQKAMKRGRGCEGSRGQTEKYNRGGGGGR